ncbi:MAG: amidohydrolase [Oscillospiraceae bacterium]|nr:amidohydrolase [Oscillospiraceae bacterium]
MKDRLVKYRRDLHKIPEIDFELPKTIQYIKTVLERYPCEVFSSCRSSVCAFFDCGKEKTTAFRADMDALPIAEKTNAKYASEHLDKMHACGHDGHMAVLLAFAEFVSREMKNLPRNILLIFQPAEETTGGAKLICESGVFEKYNVDRIFGLHLWPELAAGQLASRAGALMAKSSETTLTVAGKSTHIARHTEGNDAMITAAKFLCRAYEIMENLAEKEECLLKFGRFESGTVRNAISGKSVLMGSLRVFSNEMFEAAVKNLEETAKEEAEKTGCSVRIEFSQGYPPVRNDGELYERCLKAAPNIVSLEKPLLIAEDFSFYQEHIKGVFFLLGTGTGIPLHADTFDFDEDVLSNGVELFKRLAFME